MACTTEEIAPDTYAAVFETKVAYMKFRFKVTVQVVRAEEPREIEAKVEGTPLGIVGRLTATSLTRLTEAGDETKIDYDVDAALTGKLGSIGQPVLRSKAKEMERQFAARLAAAFASAGGLRPSSPRKRGPITPPEFCTTVVTDPRFRGRRHSIVYVMTRTHRIDTDVLVIGSGAAGMYAAIEAARGGAQVLLADRSLIGRGGATVMAQMTVACALGEETPDDLAASLRRHHRGRPRAVRRDAGAAAVRGRARLHPRAGSLGRRLGAQGRPHHRDHGARPRPAALRLCRFHQYRSGGVEDACAP